METINIHPDDLIHDSSDNSSLDTANRVEMLWTPRMQVRLEKWQEKILKAKDKHNACAKSHKLMHRLLGIPSAIIPLTVGIIGSYLRMPVLNASLLAIAASLSAINTSLNYGSSMQKHYTAETDYGRLSFKLDYIIAQPKSNRQACDVTMTEIRYTLSEIESRAPDV